MQDEHTNGMIRWALNNLINACENEPEAVKQHYRLMREHVEYVVTTVDGYIGNFYTPVSRTEVEVYKQQLDNALEPSFTAMKQLSKEVKQLGYDNTGCKEVIEQFKNAMTAYIRLVEKNAKARLPEN